jgi:hypothetical protein
MENITPELRAALHPRVQVLRIITVAMVNGVLVYLGVVLYIHIRDGHFISSRPPVLTYSALGIAAVLFLVHIYLPRAVVAAGRKKIARGESLPGADDANLPQDLSGLCVLYRSSHLLSIAPLVAAGFLAAVAYFAEESWILLVLEALLVIAMVREFPTMASAQKWLEEQEQLILAERNR